MATARSNNVIVIDTDNATLTGQKLCIESILYVAGTTSPSASIRMTDTNGTTLWTSGTTADNARLSEQHEIYVGQNDTLHFDLAGTGTKLYLYLD